jgi:hypothetical protein
VNVVDGDGSTGGDTTDGGSTGGDTTDTTDGGSTDGSYSCDNPAPSPTERCFTSEFWNYGGEGDCGNIWKIFDNYCMSTCLTDTECGNVNEAYSIS